ncbi:MAG: T9SS type A sorting domain-containing protein, partial [Bacteroidota bacterium]|nr:T9SS type A sorting domain-containing protein [Bacteroidota bacterium]
DFQGKPILTPHYQRLAWIRGTYPTFTTQVFDRIATGNGNVYGVVRKYENENGISLSNFGSTAAAVTLSLTNTGNVLFTNLVNGKPYFASDVYNDTTYQIAFYGGTANLSLTIPAYGSAVLIVSDSAKKLVVPTLLGVNANNEKTLPERFSLSQNYPNPFNPSTTINYQLPVNSNVSLKVYDILGKEVITLVHQEQRAGTYSVKFAGEKLSTGIYFYRLQAGSFVQIKKMLLMK